MLENPFVLPTSEYKRDLDFMRHYVEQGALYLQKTKDISYEDAKNFIIENLKPGGLFEFKDRVAHYTERQPNGDRIATSGGYYTYIREAIRQQDIIAPTLTTYINPKIYESPLVASIERNKAKRSENKRMMFTAMMAGNNTLYEFKDREQTGNKLSNNALSGAHVSPSTPLYNKSAHSTLTSGCRVTSGYGNANNEKFIVGNRHYYNEDIVRNNITSIIANTDYAQLEATMTRHGIVCPTAEQALEVIKKSALQYWRDDEGYQRLYQYLLKLTPYELAAFVYTGDFYHIRQFNPQMVRTFLKRLSHKSTTPHPDPDSIMSKAEGDYIGLANQIHGNEMKGQDIKKLKGTELYALVAATVANIYATLEDYRDFIRTFFNSMNVPASLAYFPSSIRHSALTSDTDSTIFTVQDWVEWEYGDCVFHEEAMGLAATLVFLASQSIVHTLAIMSANFGIGEERLFDIAMKNEFKFDVFVPMNQTKHYYAAIGCREGNVFDKHKLEVKGVHLKSSNAPKIIMQRAADKMQQITERIMRGEKISIVQELTEVADLEREIKRSLQYGDRTYFRIMQIKDAKSYGRQGPQSPYANYTMWQEVFAPKYGNIDPPPYQAIKVNTDMNSPTKFNAWLKSMSDQQLAQRMKQWAQENEKTTISTFYLPISVVTDRGIPEEILSIMDIRRLIAGNTKVFYMILESLGFYIGDEKLNRLVSDFY